MILLGLTGSIGMGKSTTTAMFGDAGAAIYDADISVHALYAAGGAGVEPVGAVFPDVVVDGAVDRRRLSAEIARDPTALKALERIVHPLLADHRRRFLETAQADGRRVAVLDVPLLFETGGEASVDAVVVVSAPPEVQMARVLARPGMDAAKLQTLLARQLDDAEKRRRADYVIDTGLGLDAARAGVASVLQTVLAPDWRPPRGPRPSAALDAGREAPQGTVHGA